MLDQALNEYLELQAKADEIDSRLKELKSQIISEMNGETTYSNDQAKATVILAESIKYDDKVKVIDTFKNNGYSKFIVEDIDTKAANKFIKEHEDNEMVKGLRSSKFIKSTWTEKLKVENLNG